MTAVVGSSCMAREPDGRDGCAHFMGFVVHPALPGTVRGGDRALCPTRPREDRPRRGRSSTPTVKSREEIDQEPTIRPTGAGRDNYQFGVTSIASPKRPASRL